MNEEHNLLIEKALRVIESISATVGNITTQKITIDRKIIDDIYCYAHIALGTCDNLHKDWVEQLNKHYEELKKLGEF